MRVRIRSAVLVASAAALVGAGTGAAQIALAATPVGGIGGTPPVAGPLPPVGSVPTTPTAPPSTACGPGPTGGDVVAFQRRIWDHWPALVNDPYALGIQGGFWFDNDVPAVRLDVLDASQVQGLCDQAVAAGVGGDVRVDVVPTTQAQIQQMRSTIEAALEARFGPLQTRVDFGIPSIRTWSLDIQVRPGIDHAVVDQIAQTQPVAYAIRESTDDWNSYATADVGIGGAPLPQPAVPAPTPTPKAQVKQAETVAAPRVSVPKARSRRAARSGVLVRVSGAKPASRITVAILRGKTAVAKRSTTAPKTGTTSASLRVPIPRTAIGAHGSTGFTVRTTLVAADGTSVTTSAPLRVG